MANVPNFTAQLDPARLDDLRRLARALDLTLSTGPRAGEGSPRQLLDALANAVKRHGIRRVAGALRDLLRDDYHTS